MFALRGWAMKKGSANKTGRKKSEPSLWFSHLAKSSSFLATSATKSVPPGDLLFACCQHTMCARLSVHAGEIAVWALVLACYD